MKSKIKTIDKDKSGIYKITNTITLDFYIGSAVKLSRRIYRHRSELKNNSHYNIKLQRAVNKYGLDNFTVECLEFCEKELLLTKEQYYVNLLNPKYNIQKECVYSNLGVSPSEETKQKISLANKGKIRTDECKNKIREFNLGKKASNESKLKMSIAQRKRVRTEEHNAKIGEAHKNKKRSIESIAKSIKTKKEKGKMKGVNNIKAKLNLENVNFIINALKTQSVKDLATQFNVSYQTIWGIKNNKTWQN